MICRTFGFYPDNTWEKSLRELTGQKRHASNVAKERPARNQQFVTCAGMISYELLF